MIKIDKGILLPARSCKGRPAKYPWRQMDVGDSFFVEARKSSDFGGAINHARKTTGYEFISRSVDGGLRVWRVK
jgi:hypothetical protein